MTEVSDEMVEAALFQYDYVTSGIGWNDTKRMRSAISAALAVAPKSRVKALAWRVFCGNSGNSEAVTPFGRYVIQIEDAGWALYPFNEGPMDWGYSTREAAKAAAQADYERRILSALEDQS
jgi:hypothetical protein